MVYIYEQEGTRSNDAKWWTGNFDDYDLYLQAVRGELGGSTGWSRWLLEEDSGPSQLRHILERSGMDKVLAAQPLKVPVMLVQALGPGRYLWRSRCLQGHQALDKGTTRCFWFLDMDTGRRLKTPRRWRDSLWQRYGDMFRQNVLRPFLDHYLKDDAPASSVAP